MSRFSLLPCSPVVNQQAHHPWLNTLSGARIILSNPRAIGKKDWRFWSGMPILLESLAVEETHLRRIPNTGLNVLRKHPRDLSFFANNDSTVANFVTHLENPRHWGEEKSCDSSSKNSSSSIALTTPGGLPAHRSDWHHHRSRSHSNRRDGS